MEILEAKRFILSYDDPSADPPADPPTDPPTDSPQKFTQEEVNKIMQKEKEKFQEKNKTTLRELEAVRQKANLTVKQREELDKTIDTLKAELMTKEELANKEKDKLKKAHIEEVTALTTERDDWKLKYTDSTISRAITDAAISHKAISPEPVAAIIKPLTHLREALDESGEPTGKLVPKVTFTDTDKDGKEVTLELSPSEATKRMKETKKYFHLFEGEGVGGLGKSSRPGGSNVSDIDQLVQAAKDGDTARYNELRKKINL